MQSLRDLKQRIRSVKNIGQITKAMEVVSMTKMRKSQAFALAARPYARAAFEMFSSVLSMTRTEPKLLAQRPDTNRLLIIVTSDKGLAGAFNENVIRRAFAWMAGREKEGKEFSVIAVGKKAKEAVLRRGTPLAESFEGFGDYSAIEDTAPVALRAVEGFLSESWSGADIIYTHFRSTLKQETVVRSILPATVEGLRGAIDAIVPEYGRFHELAEETPEVPAGERGREFLYEPSAEEILQALVPELLKVHIHHAILESNASEHSARMVAMKNASDNARELGGTLNLAYNKARQAGITQELVEVVAGQNN